MANRAGCGKEAYYSYDMVFIDAAKSHYKDYFNKALSPDPSLPQDFSKPVEYTVMAHDGSTQKYTVQILIPDKIPYGLRKESAKQLFSIRLSDIGINQRVLLSTANRSAAN